MIKLLRERRGWSQEYLANKVGCVRSLISHWETGRQKPNFSNIKRLAAVLEVSVAIIMEGL